MTNEIRSYRVSRMLYARLRQSAAGMSHSYARMPRGLAPIGNATANVNYTANCHPNSRTTLNRREYPGIGQNGHGVDDRRGMKFRLLNSRGTFDFPTY